MQVPSDAMIRAFEQNNELTPQICEFLRGKYLGPLFSLDFYRIILDEAHAIKNHSSRSKPSFYLTPILLASLATLFTDNSLF